MKRLKNNSVLSLFVSMPRRLFQENWDRATWERILAALPYCLWAVPVRNPQWREILFSVCEWFHLLSPSMFKHSWSRHQTSCHACVCSEGASGRTPWPCRCLLLKGRFEEKDFLLMDALFNKGKNLEEPEPVCLAHFSDGQISLITNFVRSTSLFKSEVTENSIRDLFECRLQVPLQATVNRYVAIFFGKLREHGLLPYSWQKIMENHKLVSSSVNNEPLRASQLRCGLSQARVANLRKKPNSNILDDGIGFYDSCDVFIKKLKECL